MKTDWSHPCVLIFILAAGCRSVDHTTCRPAHLLHRDWSGVYPTVVTPFCETGVDTESLTVQLEYQLAGNVSGLLVLGTLGEGDVATEDERAQVIATTVSVVGGRKPVVVGIHTCNVHQAQRQMLQARELGAGAVLIKFVGNRHATEDEVCGFYSALSGLNILPIFVYYYPDQTGVELSAEMIAAILRLPGIVGIKESFLDLGEIETQIELTRELDKVFLSGTALNLTQFMKIGGHGAMCAEAVLMPKTTLHCYEAFLNGDAKKARRLQRELYVLSPVVYSKPVPPAMIRVAAMTAFDLKIPLSISDHRFEGRLKYGLNRLGIPTPIWMRTGQPPPNRREKRRVGRAMRRVSDE